MVPQLRLPTQQHLSVGDYGLGWGGAVVGEGVGEDVKGRVRSNGRFERDVNRKKEARSENGGGISMVIIWVVIRGKGITSGT